MKDNKTIEEIVEEFDDKFGVVELDTGAHPLYVRKLKQFLRQALQQYGESVREKTTYTLTPKDEWYCHGKECHLCKEEGLEDANYCGNCGAEFIEASTKKDNQ